MKLSGWQRLGVVATILWIPVGFFWGNSIGIHQGDPAAEALSFCLEHSEDWARCHAEFNKSFPEQIRYHWWFAVVGVVLPVVLAWFLAAIGVKTYRWVRIGFEQ